jgi:hypothetical protein
VGYRHTICQIENLPSSKSFEEEFVKSCSLRGSYTENPEDLTFSSLRDFREKSSAGVLLLLQFG